MKRFASLAVLFALVFCFCACETIGPARPSVQQAPPPAPVYTCEKKNSVPVRAKTQYSDDYGTMITSDAAALATPARNYRWGIKNAKTLEMAYFMFYARPEGRYGHFKTTIYIDGGVKAPMTFLVRNNDRKGDVLKSVTVYPGQTVDIDVEITGVKRLHVFSELRINHDKAQKIIFGEPEFYNCK